MRLLSILSLLVLASTPAIAQGAPLEVVEAFYTTRLAHQSQGAPSGRELADYSVYLAPELVCLLGAALRYNEHFTAANPDTPSPFASGDFYASGSALPTRFSLGAQQQKGGSASVSVRFYLDKPDARDETGWEDRIQLKTLRNRWVISDIDYQGKPGSLFETLGSRLKAAEPVVGWSVRELESCTMDKPLPKRKTRSTAKPASKAKATTKAKAGSKAPASKKP